MSDLGSDRATNESTAFDCSKGKPKELRTNSIYVVHDCTIPSASCFGPIDDRGRSMAPGRDHSCCGHCRGHQRIPRECACRAEGPPYKIELCFMSFLNSTLGRKYQGLEMDINPEDVMFCYSHGNIFDKNYTPEMKFQTGVRGWSYVRTEKELFSVLDALDWFKLGYSPLKSEDGAMRNGSQRGGRARSAGFHNLILRHMQDPRVGVEKIKQKLERAITNVDGMMMKAFFMAPFMDRTYKQILKQVLSLVHEFYAETSRTYENYSVTNAAKDFAKAIKPTVATSSPEWLHYEAGNACFDCFTKNLIRGPILHEKGKDPYYLDRVAFTKAQIAGGITRNIGYLTLEESDKKLKEFVFRLGREPTEVTQLQRELLFEAEMVLKDVNVTFEDKEETNQTRFSFKLATNADYSHHIEEGGKIAAGRDLIAKEETIAVRSLYTGEKEYVITPDENNTKVCIFFASMQQAINVLAVKLPKYRKFCKRTSYIDKVMHARGLKVREPGKDRYLVIGSATRYFLMTPAARLIADMLGKIPEFHMGLKSFGQAFRVREAMSTGELSKEIYNNRGFKNLNVMFGSSDWSNATDEIPKAFGLGIVRLLLEKADIPKFYMELILDLSRLDEIVEINDSIVVNSDSFNMGNVLTKGMLTLTHGALFERAANISNKNYRKVSPEWQDLKIPGFSEMGRGFVTKPDYDFVGHANF